MGVALKKKKKKKLEILKKIHSPYDLVITHLSSYSKEMRKYTHINIVHEYS